MTVAITCAGCRRTLRVAGDLIGQTVRCPLCIETFVAEADPVQPPVAAEKPGQRRRVVAELADSGADEPAVALLDEDAPAAASAPAAPPRTPIKPFRPVPFGVNFHSDPDRLFRGRAEAEVSGDGLRIRLRNRRDLWVPVGGARPARYMGGNRIAVFLDGREVTLAVVKYRTDLNRLARDVVGFLNGARADLNGRNYGLAWKLALLPWLAVAVPVLAIWLRVLGGVHGGGRFLWFVLAGLTFLFALKRMRREALSNGRRGLAAGTALGCCFLLLVGAYAYRLNHPTTVPENDWRPFAPGRYRARVLMPGEPQSSPNQVHAGLNTTVYTVNKHAYTIGKTFALGIANINRAQFPNVGPNTLDDRVRTLQMELASYGNDRIESVVTKSGEVGRQFVASVPNYQSATGTRETQVWRLFLIGDRLYTLWVKGEDVEADDPDVKRFFNSFHLGPASSAPSPGELDGVVAYWPFDSIVPDPHNVTSFSNVFPTEGVRDGAVAIAGWQSYVTFDQHPGLNFAAGQPFTCTGWFRMVPDEQAATFILGMYGQNGVRLELYVQNGRLVAHLNTFPKENMIATPLQGPQVSDGEWHHFALTRDADGKVTLYVGGTEARSVAGSAMTSGELATSLRTFGCRRTVQFNTDAHLNGALDEMAFFNRRLSPEEIRRLARINAR